MADIKTWDRGETIRINNTYTDSDDVVFDPTTIELKIYDPTGTLIETLTYAAGDITRVSAGIYYYDYTVAADALIGWYINKWTGITSGFSDVSKTQFRVADPETKLYCTPDEVWMRAGQDETFVTRNNVVDYIEKSMIEIDKIYQKNFFYNNDVTEWFDTVQPDSDTIVQTIFLLYTPIRSITSVKEYDKAGDEVANHTSDDYIIDFKTGRLKMRMKNFAHQAERLKIVYIYGYDNIPAEINALCVILASMKVLLNFVGESVDQVTSYNACGISVSVGEPYTAASKGIEILIKERDKLLANIGRLRPSIFIG